MRTLTRMRLLAAVCALLLTFASVARAGPSRPIDRPDTPIDPTPVQVGDPDQPGGSLTITFTLLGRVYLLRVPWIAAAHGVRGGPTSTGPLFPRKGRHAR